jgi:hypothetical protein
VNSIVTYLPVLRVGEVSPHSKGWIRGKDGATARNWQSIGCPIAKLVVGAASLYLHDSSETPAEDPLTLTSENDDGGTSSSLSQSRAHCWRWFNTGERARMRVGTYTQRGGAKWSQQPRNSPMLRDSGAGFRALSTPLLFSSRSDRDEGKPVIRDPQVG